MNDPLVRVESNFLPLPPYPGLLSKISIDIHDEFEEFVEDQNGMVTHLGTYHPPHFPSIELITNNFTPRNISQLLQSFIEDTRLCQILGDRIGLDSAFTLRHGCGCFQLSVDVKLIREVLVLLPPSVPVLSNAASDHVLQRLADEQSVEITGLEEGEENAISCSICMENFSESSDDESVIKMPRCLHLFHQGCLFEWLKQQNSCPLCRRVPYGVDDYEDSPPFHNWYFESISKRRFGFLIGDGFVYLAIVDEVLGKISVLKFLEHLRDEFKKAARKNNIRGSFTAMIGSVNVEYQLVPVVSKLIASLERDAEAANNDLKTSSLVEQTNSTKAHVKAFGEVKQQAREEERERSCDLT
ncbi:unnamed protein product [Microthlaspi erraticum]|uniref:RING-type domain-containing protein n=1 Tax=Microthlaspi erraticum TaxID=1685480 RepID=A0A6D2KSC0_9BRAS|nr:unnamed protein product [Microthlaspi erraticum]